MHYQALRASLWETLRKHVFPEFKSRQKEFRRTLQAQTRAAFGARFIQAVDELPAPVTDPVSFEEQPNTTLFEVLKTSRSGLRIELTAWNRLVADAGLNKEAQDRLLRVLTILVSSEMLTDIREEEFAPLLQGLAIAVQ